MNTDKHTPSPWIAERGGTVSAAGRVVATCGIGMQHNAARIVHCVNAHDDLVAALHEFLRAYGSTDAMSERARAALAKTGAA